MKVDTCKICKRAFWSTATDNGVCHECNLEMSKKKKPRKKEVLPRRRFGLFPIKDDAGYVYLLKSENGFYKIGKAKQVKDRLLSWKRTFPVKIELVCSIACHSRGDVEKLLHKRYWAKRAEREWFRLDDQDVQWITSIKDYQLG